MINTNLLERIETEISQLTLVDQLWLVERLIQLIRKREARAKVDFDDRLTAMAYDPEMRQQLQEIENEFAVTEEDGLVVSL